MSFCSLGRPSHRVCTLAFATLLLAYATLSAAPKPAAKSAAADAEPKKGRAPRLPAYYAGVVKEDQRAKIAAIQEEFAPRIEKKRHELNALIDEQDAAIRKLLTPQQRKQVESLRAAAKSKRESSGDDSGDAEVQDESRAGSKAAKSTK